MADTTLKIILQAVDNTKGAFGKLNKNLKKTSIMSEQTARNMKRIGVVGAGLGIAIGKKAVDAAVSFEQSMSNVSTILDTNIENMEEMKKEVLDMSARTPVALEDLTEALYDVRSAGIAAEGAMDTLEASAKLATAGLGSTKDATNILTSAINAFGLNSKDAEKHADVFFKAVKSGKTTVSDLAQGFGQVAPLANAMGVQFEELMAITSAMTTSGLKASIAYSQVRAALSNLAKPTREMQEIFENLGITNIQNEIQNKGLRQTIIDLAKATDGNNEMLAKAFGSVEALNAVMMLMGNTGEMTSDIFNEMTGGVNAMNEAFEKQNQTTQAQFQLLKNKLNQQMIELGVIIIPKLLAGIENSILILREWKSWFDSTADAIGTVIYQAGRLMNKLSFFQKAKVLNPITAISSALRGRLPGFDMGGVVPGPVGKPQLAMVHGGETILPTHKEDTPAGATFNFDFSNANIVDKDELVNNIIKAVNRTDELTTQGAM